MIYVVIIDVYNFFVGYYGNIEGICKGVRRYLSCCILYLYVFNIMR